MAPKYDGSMVLFEKLLLAGGRQWVCSQSEGDVLELGVGTGRNFDHYSLAIQLTGVDLSEQMLEFARARARELGREADLRVGDAQALDFAANSFDTVVCTLTLCSVPDDGAVVREVKRVLRPGGRFLAVEHVASPVWAVRMVQKILDWVSVRTVADHLVREPLLHLQAEGFQVERVERRKWGIIERVAARKPTS
jgi:ubiquinone/menaquinone biosynthesis C-methylase UbiE